MAYEQEWARHQALLQEVEKLNKELQVAEAARNAAMQTNRENGQQPDITPLENKVEQLREEKAAAETRVSEFELQVAQTNPEHAQWLSEQQPPAQENKSKEAYIDLAVSITEEAAKHMNIMDSFGGSSVTDPLVTGLNHLNEHKDAIAPFLAGWTKDKIDTAKEFIYGPQPEKEEIKEKTVEPVTDNPHQQPLLDEKKELRSQYDKEFTNMYDRHQQELTELTKKQVDEIRQTGQQTPEMQARFSEEHKQLTEQHLKEFTNIENRECKEKADWILKEWKNDIDQNEQVLKDRMEKELKNAEKNIQNQIDKVEKKYEGKEKEDNLNLIKKTEEQVKTQIQEKMAVDFENIQNRKDHLEQVKEATKAMEEKQRLNEIEKQREIDRQRELERQRQLEEQARRR